ncbi:MAG: YD repeat-containing protein, partial [Mariniblastus sp.]|nr:YD repeat-containing protein [Mariniblastus sp.]
MPKSTWDVPFIRGVKLSIAPKLFLLKTSSLLALSIAGLSASGYAQEVSQTTTHEYDERGRLTTIREAGTIILAIEYDGSDQPVRITQSPRPGVPLPEEDPPIEGPTDPDPDPSDPPPPDPDPDPPTDPDPEDPVGPIIKTATASEEQF